jgi:putative spermidine/putrescine transport system substrate-binding protein
MADRETQFALATLRQVLEETKHLDRRDFLRRMAQVAAGSALLGSSFEMLAGHSASAAEKPVTTLGWGGAWQEAMETAFFRPWTQKSGTPVQYIAPYDFNKIRAMDQAKQQQIDVLEAGSIDTPRMIKFGLNAPLDFTVIDKSALSPGQLRYGNAIGAITLSTLMVYNKKKWPGDDHPKSWADFWDVKRFPGPRSLQRRCLTTMEAALMADGVPADPEKMYPLDVDRAFKKLDEIKPHIKTWWSSGTEPQQFMQDEEVDLCMVWNGRASDSINNRHAPYEIVWNQALYNGDIEAWFLLRNCPNPQGGMKLLDFVGRAEPQAAFARALFYGPTNLKAYDYIDEKLAKQLPSYPDNAKVSLLVDYNWWLDHYDELTLKFETWIQS